MRILQTGINMFDASNVYTRIFVLLLLLALITDVNCQTTSTARCNECFTNGVACLDEQNFSICISGTPINIRTSCPTGAVCTAEEDICVATAQGGIPACFEDKCGKCLSAEKNFACLDENIYAFCYDGETPDSSSVNYCPLGNVCDLNNINICSPTQSATPSCVLDTTTSTTTETTTDLTTATTTETTTDTTTGSSSDVSTDSTTGSTTISTSTDTTTGTSTLATTDTTTETTTDLTTASSTETTTIGSTIISTSTDTTTDTTIETTTISTSTDTTTATSTLTTTDKPTGTTTDTTTVSTTPSTTHTTTDATTGITTTTTTTTAATTTVSTTPSTTQTTEAPKDPNTFCAEIGRNGYFRADGDNTCTKYIYCYGLSGQYLGWEYTCANYFNAATGKCQTERPADC